MSHLPEEHGTPQAVEEVEVDNEATTVESAEVPGNGTPQAEAGESR